MTGLLMAMLSVAAAFWMYFDATKHGIGKDPSKPSLWQPSAGGWAAWGIVCWPLGLPIYLFRRASLIETAKQYPITPKDKTRSLAILSIASLSILALNLSGGAGLIAQSASPDSTTGWAASEDVFMARWNTNVNNVYRIEGFHDGMGNFLGGRVIASRNVYSSAGQRSIILESCIQTVQAALGVPHEDAKELMLMAYNRSQMAGIGIVDYQSYVVGFDRELGMCNVQLKQ